MAAVLLIEDDHRIRESFARSLAKQGHDVASTATGLAGLEMAIADDPEVLVLDLGLPDIDGVDLLRMIRAVSSVLIIVATARDDEAEIVRTLDAGADDYVIKPFSTRQLDARIRALLRRASTGAEGQPVEIGDLVVDARSRVARLGGRELDLTRKEFDLLLYLAERPGTVVSKRELQAQVWRQPYGGADKTVDVHVSWLRKKLGETAAAPRLIHTVRGVGVKLADPDSTV